jgi:DNA-binding transcriptional LysR family regulator
MVMRFSLRQIEYFVAAGEEGSILAASERLNISSASVSTAISQLETAFGIQLFIRHHAQGLSLTSEGRRFLAESKRLLGQAAGMHGFADEMAREVRGPLAVGCLVVFAAIVLPNLRRSFEAAHAGVLWSSTYANQALLLDKLRSAEIDVALTYDLDIPKDIAFEPLAHLKAHALFAQDHPFADRRCVALAELAELPMILLDMPLSREYFLGLYQAAGVMPAIRERVADYHVLRSMVANGFGYSLGHIRPLSSAAADGKVLRSVPLKDVHRPMRLGVATAREGFKPKVIDAFEAHCRAVIRDDAIPGMAPPLPE